LHLEGDSLGSIARLYIDGIEVSSGSILDDFPSHTADITWGQTDTNLLVGGSQQSFDATLCLQSDYAFWGNSTVQVTATQIREELFEKGALPDITIAADTTANMQIALDAIASTVRPNWPLAILIKQSTDETNFGLDADNITFNSLASIHVDYD
jgi:hypothetical protein